MADPLTSAQNAYHRAVLKADKEYARVLKSKGVAYADAAFEEIVADVRKAYDKALLAAHKTEGGVDEDALSATRAGHDVVLQYNREAKERERVAAGRQ